jgi:hypothetical protein
VTRWLGFTGSLIATTACGPADIAVGYTGFATGSTGMLEGTDAGTTTASTLDDTSSDTTDTTAPSFPDIGNIPPVDPPPDTGIPTTCAEAEMQASTVGCLFFGADLDVHPLNQAQPWGLTVANIQTAESELVAHVTAEVRFGDAWHVFEEVDLQPNELHLFLPGQFPHDASMRLQGATLRVRADIPIIAHQFNPIAMARETSDASLLYPVSAWDYDYVVMGRPHIGEDAAGELYPYLTIVASEDDTIVEIVPSIDTRSGSGVAGGTLGEPLEVTLQEGELLQLAPASSSEGATLTGTTVNAPPGKPVAVFSGHRCAYVPGDTVACDHLEEQLTGRHQWGRTYAAVRAMPRLDAPEPVLWQILAGAHTTVEFHAHDDVTGLPVDSVDLGAGDYLELMVSGTAEHPGDFLIESDEPIAVMQYTVGGAMAGNFGDPAAILLAPTDQFIERLVLLVPEKWAEDHIAITRAQGADVWLDGVLVEDEWFTAIDDSGDYEAARVDVEDGVHTLVSTAPLSAIVVGYDAWDSYGYLGGARTSTIWEPAG